MQFMLSAENCQGCSLSPSPSPSPSPSLARSLADIQSAAVYLADDTIVSRYDDNPTEIQGYTKIIKENLPLHKEYVPCYYVGDMSRCTLATLSVFNQTYQNEKKKVFVALLYQAFVQTTCV